MCFFYYYCKIKVEYVCKMLKLNEEEVLSFVIFVVINLLNKRFDILETKMENMDIKLIQNCVMFVSFSKVVEFNVFEIKDCKGRVFVMEKDLERLRVENVEL